MNMADRRRNFRSFATQRLELASAVFSGIEENSVLVIEPSRNVIVNSTDPLLTIVLGGVA